MRKTLRQQLLNEVFAMECVLIVVNDKDTANAMEKIGYRMIGADKNGIYWFQNNKKIDFDKLNIDKSTVAFTNIMHI